MSDVNMADAVLRQFLLGKIDDEQRQGIEGLFVSDASFNERLLSLEQDLIDDYVDGSLTKTEAESFRRQYASTATQRQRLVVSKSVKKWADDQLRSAVPDRSRRRISLRPIVVVPVAAVLLISTVLLVVWTSNYLERRRHRTLEAELVRTNSRAALAEVPDGMSSLTLSPVNTRTVDTQSSVNPGATELLELRLLWIRQEIYPSYKAVLLRVNGSESYTIEDLYVDGEDKNLIRLRVPTQLLTRGQFRVTLTGMTPDSRSGMSDEYQFSILR